MKFKFPHKFLLFEITIFNVVEGKMLCGNRMQIYMEFCNVVEEFTYFVVLPRHMNNENASKNNIILLSFH